MSRSDRSAIRRASCRRRQIGRPRGQQTWPVENVRLRMARPAAWAVRPEVGAVNDTGFPKNGKTLPGVARQHSGTPGIAPLLGGGRR
ncbi:transposase [Kitasatospora sp. NPDC056181]|uniref:transposase n=1 Tax=Kitasatospora sp. NPDC056181 TaxID=3345737 RepID=UPI0035E16CBC